MKKKLAEAEKVIREQMASCKEGIQLGYNDVHLGLTGAHLNNQKALREMEVLVKIIRLIREFL